jgi:hypothetical protein
MKTLCIAASSAVVLRGILLHKADEQNQVQFLRGVHVAVPDGFLVLFALLP